MIFSHINIVERGNDIHMKNQNTYDANFKRIIANKSLLCYILKNFVDEYKEVEESEIRKLLNVNLL